MSGRVSSQAGSPNWRNRTLFHGDNLRYLRAMNGGTVDLIATDPPFNKGRDFHATPDSLAAGARFQDRWSWEADVHEEWVDRIQDDHPGLMATIQGARQAHSDGMGAFLCFMAVRLLEMHRVLKDSGSMYLHCDATAAHYLKAVMDAIFGWDAFINEIIWHYDGPRRPSRRKFGAKHDTIFRYARTSGYFSEPTEIAPFQILVGEELKKYKRLDDGRYYYTTPRGDYTDASIRRLSAEDRIETTRTGKVRVRHFLPVDERGRVGRRKQLHDVWSDITSLGHAGGEEKVGYPTQKPLALYERLIRAASRAGDVILDPFAGCATTLIAAERLGRSWVGIDIWEEAHRVMIDRLKKEGLGVPGQEEGTLALGTVHYSTEPPNRSDDGEAAAPFPRVKERVWQPEGRKTGRAETHEFLVAQHGS